MSVSPHNQRPEKQRRMNPTQCPKCAYERLAADTAPSYECPKCGIVYAKYQAIDRSSNASGRSAGTVQGGTSATSHSSIHKFAKKFAYILAAIVALAVIGYLIDPRVPIIAALAVGAVWLVRKAIDGSREQERKEVAALEALPFQHCMTCGHDFKHGRSALRGSTTMEIALWILLLWPIALVYSIWRRLGAGKAKVACLVCASTQVVPATSPAAVAHKRTLGIQDA